MGFIDALPVAVRVSVCDTDCVRDALIVVLRVGVFDCEGGRGSGATPPMKWRQF